MIDEKTKAWLVNQYDGSESASESAVRGKKKKKKVQALNHRLLQRRP